MSRQFVNRSGEIIPRYAVLLITGMEDQFLVATQPMGAPPALAVYFVNGGESIADGNVGECFEPVSGHPVLVRGTALRIGEQLGPRQKSWHLHRCGEGFRVTGVWNPDAKTVVASLK